LRDDETISQLTGFFSLAALFLACLGLYGVIACSVVRRTGEIGVRLALGADRSHVLWMVLRDSLILVSVGILIGIPGALLTTRFASSLLFGLGPSDPLTIVTATFILFVVAMLAGYIPARRASRLDPASALRHERKTVTGYPVPIFSRLRPTLVGIRNGDRVACHRFSTSDAAPPPDPPGRLCGRESGRRAVKPRPKVELRQYRRPGRRQ
jgi:predicted lysophospholipase L1 biosynthesis ABC-type transport system permease subunit